MLRRAAFAGAVFLSASCAKSEGGDTLGSAFTTASTKPPTSGFSVDMAKELGVGGTKPDPARAGAGDAKAGSDGKTTGDTRASGAKVAGEPGAAGDAKVGDATTGDSKAARDPGAASGAKVAGEPGAAGDGRAGDGKAGGKSAGDGKTAIDSSSTGEAKASGKAGNAGSAVANSGAAPGAAAPHGPVKVPADLAAIKLSLLPNWDRDIDEPGTFQYVVRIKGTQGTKTFSFRYGYEDPKAPAEREQYKKYLQDTGAMAGEIRDRQRGGAWFLEGNDATGMPAFRYVVVYGGKHLICYGSQYKDAESNRLGDDRDQTLIQAKQICETLAL